MQHFALVSIGDPDPASILLLRLADERQKLAQAIGLLLAYDAQYRIKDIIMRERRA
jgi:hypothetical protein